MTAASKIPASSLEVLQSEKQKSPGKEVLRRLNSGMTEKEFLTLLKLLDLDYDLFSPQQKRVLRLSFVRLIFITGGVRGGKSFISAMKMLCHIYNDITKGLVYPGDEYWLVGSEYINTTAEYGYLRDWLTALGWVTDAPESYEAATMKINICPLGCDVSEKGKHTCSHRTIKVITKSTKMALNKIASTAPCMILVCEAAQMSQETFDALVLRTTEKRAQMVMSGTMDRLDSWFLAWLKRLKSPAEQKRLRAIALGMPTVDNKVLFDGDEGTRRGGLVKRTSSLQIPLSARLWVFWVSQPTMYSVRTLTPWFISEM